MMQPRLRFLNSALKSFDDLEILQMSDICKINQGLQIAISERYLENGPDRFFYITNEFLKVGAKNKYFIKNPPTSVICTSEDILMTRTGNTGKVVTDVSGAFHNNFFKIEYDRSRVNKFYLVQFLSRPKTQADILRLAGASTIPDLNHSDFYSLPIPLPNILEQNKVAAFLAAVDKKINQLTKKHELLTQYKKSVMQNIFNQELRFKANDGNDYPDWSIKKFGEMYCFKTTNSFSRECLNYETGKVKNIHYGDIHTKFKQHFDIEEELVPYVNEDIDLKNIKEDCYCKEGDLIIADASEDYDDIGKCIEIVNAGKQKLLSGLHTILAKPITSDICIGYISYAMKSFEVRHQIKVIAQGTKVLSISAIRLSEVSIPIPTFQEQTKIVNFLSAIDIKIQITQAQLETTKKYKQGLLQQMFV
jgi:type I restriction enzyme S subunit